MKTRAGRRRPDGHRRAGSARTRSSRASSGCRSTRRRSTIFGATGDLAKRKLLPAIYNLAHEGALPERFNLIGVLARRDVRRRVPRDGARSRSASSRAASPTRRCSTRCSSSVRYVPGSFDDDSVYEQLDEGARASSTRRPGIAFNRAFYLSTAPTFFPVIVEQARRARPRHATRTPRCGWSSRSRSARTWPRRSELNRRVLDVFDEDQVFRIDHYLGKETVQNMLAFRFANGMFEPIWNRNYIDNVQITAAEDIGIGTRAGYYDTVGRAARPGPEPHAPAAVPALHGAAGVLLGRRGARREGQGAARDPRRRRPRRSPRWRCAPSTRAGTVGGEEVPGYLEEEGVPDDSTTETYAALRLEVDNWRWAGRAVLPAHRQAPGAQGHRDRGDAQAGARTSRSSRRARSGVQPNQLILTMQPNEGVSISLGAKIPGHADAHPAGEHGVPLRHVVHVAVARGLRAADHGRDARRRHAVHPRRRGRGRSGAICDPILEALGGRRPGRCPQYEAGSQRARRRRTSCCAPAHHWRAI